MPITAAALADNLQFGNGVRLHTDAESVTVAVGSGERPTATRARSRSASCSRCHAPRA